MNRAATILVERNVLSHLAGGAWSALLSIAFVPTYLRFVGPDGVGLIGVFTALSTLFLLLDPGLGAAVMRALSRSQAREEEFATAAELTRGVERITWSVALCFGIAIALAAPAIADSWLNVEPSRRSGTVGALRLMGGSLVLHSAHAYYGGCLLGLQRQVAFNAVLATSNTLRAVGAVLMLWLVSPTIEAFFLWHLAVGIVTVATERYLLSRDVPLRSDSKVPGLREVWAVRRFALGAAGFNLLEVLLLSADKIVLSKLLPLALFGYYVLAWTLLAVIVKLVESVFHPVYPRLTQLFASQSYPEIAKFFDGAAQLMAVLVVPVGLFLGFYGRDVVQLWTADAHLGAQLADVMVFLALGSVLHGLLHAVYALSLASGSIRGFVAINAAAVVAYVFMIFAFTDHFGFAGSAAAWMVVNVGCLVLAGFAVRSVLKAPDMLRWYLIGVVAPIAGCALWFLATRTLFPLDPTSPAFLRAANMAVAGLSCQLMAMLALPVPRARMLGRAVQ